MITLSFSSDKGAKKTSRGAHEQQIRDIVDTHLAFPGSEKLKMGLNIKDNGDASVSFTGPKEALAEAQRLWREHVKPAVAKVKRTTAKVKRTAIKRTVSAAKPLKRKLAQTAKSKRTTAKKSTKRVVARAKAKVSRTKPKKRKS